MLDLIKRYINKNAFIVSNRIRVVLKEQDMLPEFGNERDRELIFMATKSIYSGMLMRVSPISKKNKEIDYLIENVDLNEQGVVDYFKSTVWNYNRLAETEIEQYLEELKIASRLMEGI